MEFSSTDKDLCPWLFDSLVKMRKGIAFDTGGKKTSPNNVTLPSVPVKSRKTELLTLETVSDAAFGGL